MAGASPFFDQFSLVSPRFEPRSVRLGLDGPGVVQPMGLRPVVAGAGRTIVKTRSWYQSGGSGGELACCVELGCRTTSLTGPVPLDLESFQSARSAISGIRYLAWQGLAGVMQAEAVDPDTTLLTGIPF
ncbi:hypothetical protein F511_28750 [Dorcoceras hygrometricum]|uniref:Uncharacterized protein n=1 Tax=Dorcoceras hygrometricum TaxID=472368 RepID=A0A2Z7BZK8_9LAMI|nr:hypothetical protein F511_28750 [Dorcoceras hygrometricum]